MLSYFRIFCCFWHICCTSPLIFLDISMHACTCCLSDEILSSMLNLAQGTTMQVWGVPMHQESWVTGSFNSEVFSFLSQLFSVNSRMSTLIISYAHMSDLIYVVVCFCFIFSNFFVFFFFSFCRDLQMFSKWSPNVFQVIKQSSKCFPQRFANVFHLISTPDLDFCLTKLRSHRGHICISTQVPTMALSNSLWGNPNCPSPIIGVCLDSIGGRLSFGKPKWLALGIWPVCWSVPKFTNSNYPMIRWTFTVNTLMR